MTKSHRPDAAAAQRDALRTARLNGLTAARPQKVPPAPLRLGRRVVTKLGSAPRWSHDGITGRSKVLVRVDEFPHYRALDDPSRYGTEQFERFHAILADA